METTFTVERDLDSSQLSKRILVRYSPALGYDDEVRIKKDCAGNDPKNLKWNPAQVLSPTFPCTAKSMPRLLAALAIALVEANWLDEQYPTGELLPTVIFG